MHILFLPSWYPETADDVSGVFFRDQALALLESGHKVGVIAPLMRSIRTLLQGDVSKKVLPVENGNGLPAYREGFIAALPRVPYGNYLLFKRAARNLLRQYISDHGKPDILHAHVAVFGGAVGAKLSKEFKIPLVLTEHSSAFAREIYSWWQLRLANYAIGSASICIAVSPSLGKILSAKFSENQTNWQWIPNVVGDRFTKSRCRGLQDRPIRFLSLAIMTHNKGQLDLLHAFQQLKNKRNTELWLAGDGPMRTKLEKTVLDIGISERVRFLGAMVPSQVPALLSEIDIMVVSSHYETFGVVAAEALMAGRPVVATRCGGPECIVEEGDGLLVPPNQPSELANAMQQVAHRLSGYNPVAIAERAKARFSGPVVAARLTAEYKKLVASSSSSHHVG